VAELTRRALWSFAPLLAATGLVAGCGGAAQRAAPPPPRLPRALAHTLAARSDEVAARLAAGDSCGALASARALQQETIAAINAGRVPGALQEPLAGAAARVVSRISCAPRAAPLLTKKPHGKKAEHGKHGHGKGGEND
jgi:hypothetical protein